MKRPSLFRVYEDGYKDLNFLGDWWSATSYNTTSRYYLGYDSSSGQFAGNYSIGRSLGLFVRCVNNITQSHSGGGGAN